MNSRLPVSTEWQQTRFAGVYLDCLVPCQVKLALSLFCVVSGWVFKRNCFSVDLTSEGCISESKQTLMFSLTTIIERKVEADRRCHSRFEGLNDYLRYLDTYSFIYISKSRFFRKSFNVNTALATIIPYNQKPATDFLRMSSRQ